MAEKMSCTAAKAVLIWAVLLFFPMVRSDDAEPIPADKSQLNSWFDRNVGPFSSRKNSIQSVLAGAEGGSKVIRVKADGSGEFPTITDAINSIPQDNAKRVIISIGPGNYTEKVKIDRYKPFITLYGDPKDMPTLVFDGNAAKYGTTESGTLSVESDYFTALNLRVVNSAPRPDGKIEGAQAVAVRISGDNSVFYNCKFYGYQDTLLDDSGKHLFKDCYIEGTVDFIFGSGRSLYLNSEIHVIPGDPVAIIAAQARTSPDEPNGFIFVHCKVTGTGGIAYLGRSWKDHARVIFAYSELSDVVNAEGWSSNNHPETESTVYFGEYNNSGAGANSDKRVPFAKKLTGADVQPFLSLSYIEASTWLLPPVQKV